MPTETVTRTLRQTDPLSKLIINLIEDLRNGFASFGIGTPTTTSPGTTKVRNVALNSTAAAVKASAGNIFAINIANPHSAAIFVKFYDKAAASVNPAADVPVFTVCVPATSPYTWRGVDLPIAFSTAISMRCVTGFADTDTTAAASLPIVELEIK